MESFVFPTLEEGALVARSSTPSELAAAIVDRARAEAGAIRDEAIEAGRAEGMREGLAAAEAGTTAALAALATAAERLDQLVDEQTRQLEREAVELALEIADRVVGIALELKPERVLSVVAGTLRSNGSQGRVLVELNPEDLELVRAGIDDTPGWAGRVDLVPERRVARGGCIVTSSDGETDGRIASMLERAGDVVRSALLDNTADVAD
ncbi:MAG: FliH/SctL family protein [Gaiellales bacterium]